MGRAAALLPAVLLVSTLAVGPVSAGSPYAFVPANPDRTRAFQYASMSAEFCLAELDERAVPYERLEGIRGVETPLRLSGPVRGINFVQTYRPDLDPRAAATILDCRLALAIDDLAMVLSRHGVTEVEYLSMYRPGHARRGARHASGRAIDVATVRLDDGTRYTVDGDFHGRIGGRTCGFGAAAPTRDTPGASFWRAAVCELDAMRAFNIVITPNHDRGHRDHLHLEVRSGIRWLLTQ